MRGLIQECKRCQLGILQLAKFRFSGKKQKRLEGDKYFLAPASRPMIAFGLGADWLPSLG